MRRLIYLTALGLTAAWMAGAQSAAPAPMKIGIINIQSAIVSTKDGQKAAGDLQTRFTPKKVELEKKQSEIAELQDKLNKGRNTLSEDARQGMVREIDAKTKSLTRATEDAQAEWDQEQQRIFNDMGGKMLALLDKYGKENGYSIILDVSSQQTPVLFASNSIDVTREMVDIYDKNAASLTLAPAAKLKTARGGYQAHPS
ncbi:MAG: OmpH family outer membrane protein [Candidatus Solibacter usitatus]|nr:OmpH family outer membrane protein [Candidatus Solibacter usitatus]